MHRPLLSIVIPTYNRGKFIPELLDSIVSQFVTPEVVDNIEIVIADNASTDNTEDVVKSYTSKYSNIVYFRNEKNMGFDRSFVRLVEKSSGIYCLSIGDDDAFFPDSLLYLINEIRDSDIPFYGLNNWGYDFTLQNKVLPYPSLRIEQDQSYNKLSDYVRSIDKYTNIIGLFMGLSTQLFRRDAWVAYQGKEAFFDTLAIHMYILLSVYKDSAYKILARPTIKTRSSNIRWETFSGLNSIKGRIKSTIAIVTWIRNMYSLPITKARIYIYFYSREYWFTFKEIFKRFLSKSGLGIIINIYRKLR